MNREHTCKRVENCKRVEHMEEQHQQLTIIEATLVDLELNGPNRFQHRFVEVPIGEEAQTDSYRSVKLQ